MAVFMMALPGQTFEKLFLDKFRLKGGCDLTRGTRGKAHPQSAFEVFLPNVASPPSPPEAFFHAL